MQFDKSERNLILIGLVLTVALRATGPQESARPGCVATPLSFAIPEVHIQNQERLKEISKIAFENRICLAVETAEPDHDKVSLEAQRIPMGELLRRLFPGFSIESYDSVLSLRQNDRSSWLDYKVKLFRTQRASLAFNATVQLFNFVRDQVHPPTGGYVGSFSESLPNNEVGPLTLRGHSIRELLNTLISESSKGGMWIVDQSYPLTKPFPEDRPFWKVLPYGGSMKDFLWLFEH